MRQNDFILTEYNALKEKLLLVPLAKVFIALLIGITIGELFPSISLYAISGIVVVLIASTIRKRWFPYLLVTLLGASFNYINAPDQKLSQNRYITTQINVVEVINNSNYVVDIQDERMLLSTATPLKVGDIAEAEVIVESLKSSSFRGKAKLLNIGIESYAKAKSNIKILGSVKPLVKPMYETRKFFYSIQQKLLKRADRLNIGKENKAIIKALTLGERKGISTRTTTLYSTCGVSHILSISGLHIGILFVILSTIFAFIPKYGSLRYLRTFVIIASLWFYVFISRSAPSAMRAAFMLTLLQFCYTYSRSRYQMYNILFASAIFFLLIDHTLIFDIGFQLSYLAIFAILFLYYRISLIVPIENRVLNLLTSAILITISIQILSAPLVTYYFGTLSLTGILANMVFTLLLPFLMWTSIAFITFPNDICEYIIRYILEIYSTTLNIADSIPFSSITNYYTSALDIVIYAILFILTTIYLTYFYRIKRR